MYRLSDALVLLGSAFVAISTDPAAALPTLSSGDSALNLLDTRDFFVCGAAVEGLNGHYVLSDEMQSGAPVFIREDDAGDMQAISADAHDFRLYRHNGFWMFGDVAHWPPKTHFRCDPTRRDIKGVNTVQACGMNLETPPRVGYAPVDPTMTPLELHTNDCARPLATPRAEL